MSSEKPRFTDEEQKLVDAFLLGAGLVIRSLLSRDHPISLKNLISGLSDQARDLIGVDFWKKHGAWLKDEIVKKARGIAGVTDEPTARE